ncbi:hypothetical protein ASPBRDRAFT_124108, partial [Aspergillus brasiliensis CBS 101740]
SDGRQGVAIEAMKASDVLRRWSMFEYPDKGRSMNVYLSSKSLPRVAEGVVCGTGRTNDCQATIQADGGFIADEVLVHLQMRYRQGIVNITRIEERGMAALGALE